MSRQTEIRQTQYTKLLQNTYLYVHILCLYIIHPTFIIYFAATMIIVNKDYHNNVHWPVHTSTSHNHSTLGPEPD